MLGKFPMLLNIRGTLDNHTPPVLWNCDKKFLLDRVKIKHTVTSALGLEITSGSTDLIGDETPELARVKADLPKLERNPQPVVAKMKAT